MACFQLLLLKLADGSWDLDVLSLLQLLLALNQVVDSVNQQLDQLHLKIPHKSSICAAKQALRW